MENIGEIEFLPIILQEDRLGIERKNGMPVEIMKKRASNWTYNNSVLRVYDIQFKDGHPFGVRQFGFTDYYDRDTDEFVEFMFDVSLTHKVMYVEANGYVFITESEDHQTNIDADLIAAMLNAYK
jgi:hypothetical protein